jgi:Raf kinase inhibitor-like YbhB/YbcL family protein
MNKLRVYSGWHDFKADTETTENIGGFMMHYSRFIKLTSLLLLFAGFFGCGHSSPDSMVTKSISSISLTSSAFSDTRAIPITYYYNDGYLSPDFKNYSPPLEWSRISSSTKSLVVLSWCITNDSNSVNWVLYMPGSTTTSLAENASATGDLPTGSIQGKNRLGTTGYAGPYPYADAEIYEYAFEIYALDAELALSSEPSKSDVEAAMSGHIIGYGYITGSSSRMEVSTTAFSEGGFIPIKYTGPRSPVPPYSWDTSATNANPDLSWSNTPSNTRSYTLIVEDQNGNANWIVYNIPAVYTSIPEGEDNNHPKRSGSVFGTNYLELEDYNGPNPDSGQLLTYYFRVYALDAAFDEQVLGPATKDQILSAMQGHILNEAAVSGKFIKLELNSTGRTYSDARSEYVWNDKYRYLGERFSINPDFTWNLSGVPLEAQTLVLLGTKIKAGISQEDNIKAWVLYIPQTDVYEIPEDFSWPFYRKPGDWKWKQGETDRSDTDIYWDRGYDGFAYYTSSFGAAHYYRFGLYVLASTLGIAPDEIRNSTYDEVMTAMDSATILNKGFVSGAYLNTTTGYPILQP